MRYARSGEDSIPAGIDATHQIVRRTVSLLYQEADRMYVRGSLQSTDHVVLDGLQRLVPHQWVRVNPLEDTSENAVAQITEGEKNG